MNFRLPEFTKSGTILSQLRTNLSSLADLQEQIATGRKYSRPSDAPLSVRRLLTWERQIERNVKFSSNIDLASSRLSATESSLDELNEIIRQARDTGLQLLNDSTTTDARESAAVEISALIDEAVALANRQFGDRYLFGGSLVQEPPFVREGNFIVYRGDEIEAPVEIGNGLFFADAIDGARAFGGLSSEIVGRADLDPIVTLSTRLEDLSGGRGIDVAEIELRDNTSQITVDLTGAQTIGDVVDRINATGFAVARVNAAQNGIEIEKPGANLDVLDVNGHTTARDLGIDGVNQGALVTGGDVNPALRPTTPLSELRGGAGLDLSGVRVTNGSITADVSFAGLTTVEQLLNELESAGLGLVAEIGADGQSLNLRSRVAGAEFRVEELGGSTAAELGWVVPPADLPLDQLNGGRGIFESDQTDFRIQLADGTTLDIEIQSATTLGDIVELIEDHPDNNGSLTVTLDASDTSLELTDNTTGSEDFTVSPLIGSFTASSLGIEGVGVGGVIDGSSLNPGGVRLTSVFDGLVQLNQGLSTSDRALITSAISALDDAENSLLQTRAEVGTQIRRLEVSQSRVELETFELEVLVSQEGDTDLAEAIVEFEQQQRVYEAALRTASSLVQPTLLDFLT